MEATSEGQNEHKSMIIMMTMMRMIMVIMMITYDLTLRKIKEQI